MSILRGSLKRQPETMLRWANIILRSLHIALAAVVFGGVILHQQYAAFHNWHHGVIASGLALLALEWGHDRQWPHRGKGLMVQLHILLGLVLHFWPTQQVALLWLVMLSGCIGSHMPRRFRHWSWRDGWEQRERRG